MKASKKELRREIAELRSVGHQLSNMAFNLSQESVPLDERGRRGFKELYKQWDGIKRAERT